MKNGLLQLILLLGALFVLPLEAATSITHYGITWTFDKDYPSGQFCTGDYWVVGPLNIVSITTNLHAANFTPKPGEDGSMVNPGALANQEPSSHMTVDEGYSGINEKEGYDSRLPSDYDESVNASLIGGKRLSPDNPLVIKSESSIVSMVSWLYNSATDTEPGTPAFDGGTKAPRPVTRTGAILTVLLSAPPVGSFRPPYVGTDKTIKFNFNKLDLSQLKNLVPVADTPDPAVLEKEMERPWIDHVPGPHGSMVHPSENMPNYGREMGWIMDQVALILHLDFSALPGHPTKDKLLTELVQYGIDCAGIADNGGGWRANGGIGLGRKWPILFAGVMLNDPHMKEVGKWKTRFQEDEQTFYVTQAEVDMTHSPKWKPDKRGGHPLPYETTDIGMPEWSIQHTAHPEIDNAEWNAPYRPINNAVFPGFVLAASIMGQQKAWNHDALFDYVDRCMQKTGGKIGGGQVLPALVINMWKAYSQPTLKTENKADSSPSSKTPPEPVSGQ